MISTSHSLPSNVFGKSVDQRPIEEFLEKIKKLVRLKLSMQATDLYDVELSKRLRNPITWNQYEPMLFAACKMIKEMNVPESENKTPVTSKSGNIPPNWRKNSE